MAAALPTLLVLRALGLGDLLVAVPALRGLRRRYPGHRLVLATDPRLEPVVSRIGGVDRLAPQRGLHTPEANRPDIAVDLHGVPPESIQAVLATRPRRLLAFACPPLGHHDGPALAEVEHETVKWCRLAAWCGATARPDDLLLRPAAPSPRPGVTVVHPGAAHGSKRWPPRRFAAVARALTARGHEVVLTGAAKEETLVNEVAEAAGLPPTSAQAGRTDLSRLLALVAGARLVISNDTGIAHLATAYQRPSVVLFGPASPRIWGPPPAGPHVALWRGDGERDTLSQVPDPALLAISVEEVLDAVAGLAQRGRS